MSKITIRTKTATKVAVKTILGISLLAAAAGTAAYGFASGTLSLGGPKLRITEAVSSPAPDILVQSSALNHISTFHIAMTGEDVTVSRLTLRNCVARKDADGDCADAMESPGESKAVTRAYITYPTATGTKTATTAMYGDIARFVGLDLYVNKTTGADVEVSVDLNDFATAGVASGSAIQFNADAINGPFEMVGLTSGITYTEKEVKQYTVGERMVLRNTKPTVTLSSSSASGSTVPGRGEVLTFNVSANAAANLTVDGFLFKMNATDNGASGWNDCDTDGTLVTAATDFDLYDTSPSGVTTHVDKKDKNWSLLKSDGTACDTTATDMAYARIVFPTAVTISAGTTHTFSLYFDSTGTSSASDDSMRFDIPAESATPTSLKSVTWSDGSATGIDGTLIDNLTLSGGTLIF